MWVAPTEELMLCELTKLACLMVTCLFNSTLKLALLHAGRLLSVVAVMSHSTFLNQLASALYSLCINNDLF